MARRKRSTTRKSSKSGSASALFAIAGAIVAAIAYAVFNVDIMGPAPGPEEDAPLETVSSDVVSGRASVIDADTLDIHGKRVRLVGVDAPESGQKCLDASKQLVRCGAEAANALDAWIAGNPVSCAIEGKDRYDRLLGVCTVRAASVQEWLVLNGHALAYRSYSTAYVPMEEKAEKAKAGMWAGQFVEPWEWRKGLRLPGEKPTQAMVNGSVSTASFQY
jgi:endonuclease YncB( thermonuclease family)